MWVPGSAIFNSFKNFPIPVGRALFSRSYIIMIAVIIDFICFKFSGDVRFNVIIFLALALVILLIISFFTSVFMLTLRYHL